MSEEDEKSNIILSLHDKFKKLVDREVINNYRFEYDEENEVLDIYYEPVRKIDEIDVKFTVCKDF